MDHPNIMKAYEFYEDDYRLYLVTEICNGGELFDELTKRNTFDEKSAS